MVENLVVCSCGQTKLNSIRVILSVAANRSWSLHQLDVKKAFLHGDLHQVFELRGRKGKFSGEKKRRYMVSFRSSHIRSSGFAPRAWFGVIDERNLLLSLISSRLAF